MMISSIEFEYNFVEAETEFGLVLIAVFSL